MGVPREVDEQIRAAYDRAVPPAEHLPERPSWNCRVDNMPWPCVVKREALLAEYEGLHTPLVMLFVSHLEMACRDHQDDDETSAGRMWQQLIGWIPRPAREAQPVQN